LKNEPASSIENTLFVSSRINNKAVFLQYFIFSSLVSHITVLLPCFLTSWTLKIEALFDKAKPFKKSGSV
jgi:hypothetical protein